MKKTSRWVALALVCWAPLASAAHFKLFVLTGQSNSLGTTAGGEADPSPGTDPADQHIQFCWHNLASATQSLGDSGGTFTTLRAQQGGYYAGSATHWGPEIAFGRTLYRAGVRNFGIVKASRGGGGNSYWYKSAPDHHMYTHVVNTASNAAAILTDQGHTYEFSGLLYLQGESDSTTEAAEAGNRLKMLVDNLRVDLPNAGAMFGVIGGIAAADTGNGARDAVRANQQAIAQTVDYVDYFSNLDLQSKLYDSLHFNKAAKLTVGERYTQAFFAANVVARHYGKLVFIGDSITQGGNGHPGYRYTVFSHLANRGVAINPATGYKFTGSLTGAYQNSALSTPGINGQVFENVHEGHWGWRAAWECARVALPAGRYNVNNLGAGTLLNWTGQSASFTTADAGTLTYAGTTYVPDTVSILVGINDLADGLAPTQVANDLGTLIDQLRAANPNVRIHLNKVLHTSQGEPRDTQVNTLNGLLPALVTAKNAAQTNSPVWLVDADAGFNPATQTYDGVHPNASGETYVGDRIAASLGLRVTPEPPGTQPPPHIEGGSGTFSSRFEGHEIWSGTSFLNNWKQTGTLTKTLSEASDLNIVNPGAGGAWIEGTDTAWDTGNHGVWTFEIRLKFNANPNGVILWLGTDTKRILVEMYASRTKDHNDGGAAFDTAHNNLDGQFHNFRVAHDAPNGKYHVWRDGVRLSPLQGASYDQTAAESRLVFGDYTSGTFGNNFDVTVDYIRFDFTGAYLPTGADADTDGLPDSWEYRYFGDVTTAVASNDADADGHSNAAEYTANTDPRDPASVFKASAIDRQGAAIQISVTSSAQRNYTLWRSLSLDSTTIWTPIAGPIAGLDGTLILTDSEPSSQTYYRISASLP